MADKGRRRRRGGTGGKAGGQRSGNCARMFATYNARAMAPATVTRSTWSDGGALRAQDTGFRFGSSPIISILEPRRTCVPLSFSELALLPPRSLPASWPVVLLTARDCRLTESCARRKRVKIRTRERTRHARNLAVSLRSRLFQNGIVSGSPPSPPPISLLDNSIRNLIRERFRGYPRIADKYCGGS